MIFHGDSFEILKTLSENSIESLVTDPPYGLAFMNKHWDYDVPSVDLWKECLRVMKPGAHLLSFASPRTYHRIACAIEDAGFEIRDQIQWLFGSGFPKSHNLKEVQEGFGTALKPANEPICLARKPISEKTIAANVRRWGTGGINVDGCRVSTNGSVVCKTSLGRFPANLIFSHTEDCTDDQCSLFCAVHMLDEQSGELNSRGKYKDFRPTAKGMFQGGDPKNPNAYANEKGGASRFFYCAKTSTKERNAGLEDMPDSTLARSCSANAGHEHEGSGFNQIKTVKNNHPTVKPIKLMRYLCRLVTPPHGTILDPFMGSGSTGIAAKLEGFKFVGIERERDYVAIAEKRLEAQW